MFFGKENVNKLLNLLDVSGEWDLNLAPYDSKPPSHPYKHIPTTEPSL